jgi:hypothetical protein
MKEASTMKMKLRLVMVTLALLLLAVGFNLFTPSSASAKAVADDCVHSGTIDSLEMCVKQAVAMGHITSQYVAHTLLVKLDKAEDALADDHTGTTIWWLKAFIHEVKAQSGKHIIPMHAMHLVMHAELVIQALQKE